MLKEKRLKNGVAHSGFLFVVALTAGLLLGCVRVVYSAEETPVVPEPTPAKRTSLRLAPIRFSVHTGGVLNYNLRHDTKQMEQLLSLSVKTSLRARSFIWQPWFAPVDASFGVGYGGSFARTESSASKSEVIQFDGDVAVRLQPRTRYATEISFGKFRTRPISGASSLAGSGYRRLGLSQDYQSRNQSTVGSVILGRVVAEDRSSIIKDSFSMNVSHVLASLQRVETNWNMLREYSPYLGYRSLRGNLIARHDYRLPGKRYVRSIYNNSKLNNRQFNVASSSAQQQFSSIGSATLSPELTIFGSARVQSDASAQSRSSNMSLDTAYALTPTVRASGGIRVRDESDIQTVTTTASLAASKSVGESKSTKLGVFTYRKYVSAGVSASNNVTTDTAASQTIRSSQGIGLSASLGHSISNSTKLYAGQLTSNANQTTSSSLGANGLGTLPLATNASLRWAHANEVARSSTNVRITAGDTRYFRSNNNNKLGTRQLANFQATHTQKPARFMVWSGDLTVQWASYQGAQTASASAGLKYSHGRAFQIPRMVFSSTLQTQYNLLASTGQSQGQQLTWNNGLIYYVGQLDMSLDVNMSRIGQNSQGYLLFKLRRIF